MPVGIGRECAFGERVVMRVLDEQIRGRVAHPGNDGFMQRIATDNLRRDVDTVIAQRLGQLLQQGIQIVAEQCIAESRQPSLRVRFP